MLDATMIQARAAQSASIPTLRTTGRVPARPASFALALLLAVLLSGCAAHRSMPAPQPLPMSKDSAASYAYLVFLDAFKYGNMKVAEEAIGKVLEMHPTPEAYLEAAEFHWRMGGLDKAREVLKKGLENFPGDTFMTLRLSDVYLAEQRADSAATTLELYLQKHPDDAAIRLQLAKVYLEMHKYAQTLDVLKPIPAKQQSTMMYVLRAKANTRLGRTTKAVDLLKAALRKSPEDITMWAELAYIYELKKDYAAAEKTYSHILELGEHAAEIWLRLVNLNLKMNNPDKALDLTLKGPNDTQFRLEAARMFILDGFHDQARQILDPMQSLENPPDTYHFLMALLALQGDDDPATALRHLEKIPDDSQLANRVLSYKAHLLFTLDRMDEAMAIVRQGMQRFPDNKDFYEIQSWIFEDRHDYGKAEEALQKALKKWPKDTDFLYHLGLIKDKQGQRAASLEIMERIIHLDPEHADALNYVGYVLADENRDLDRALVLVKAALKQKPDSGYILDSLAWVYHRLGRQAQAWEAISRAVSLQPVIDPTMWEHYGDIALALKRTGDARKGYTRALKAKDKGLTPQDVARIQEKLDRL